MATLETDTLAALKEANENTKHANARADSERKKREDAEAQVAVLQVLPVCVPFLSASGCDLYPLLQAQLKGQATPAQHPVLLRPGQVQLH